LRRLCLPAYTENLPVVLAGPCITRLRGTTRCPAGGKVWVLVVLSLATPLRPPAWASGNRRDRNPGPVGAVCLPDSRGMESCESATHQQKKRAYDQAKVFHDNTASDYW